jgi:superfamily II DNA/RNA helicase
MSFESLGLSEKVLAAVEAAGYREPTPIQSGAIPHVMAGKDVLGIAQTGTGKTASFVLPMLTRLEQGRARARMPRTLILEPTRELAAQVEENFVRYGVNHKLSVALLIGGVSFEEQDRKLSRGVDVLIATPGRLLDHSERGKLLMQGVEILVIDEADRMLDMGFIPDIERICKLIPTTRQTLFFSATMPPEIQRLVASFLKDPVRVEVSRPASTVDNITQRLVATGNAPQEKRDTLRRLMESAEGLKNAIIFCNRKRDVATLFRSLQQNGFSVGSLHGDMDQRARTTTLESFRKGTLTFLVASDVAARGLDIPDVSHVYNFDVPHHAEDYVHRIGRTGRAGRTGAALTIATGADSKAIAAIEKLIGRKIEWADGPPSSDEAPAPAERRGRGSRSAAPRERAEAPAEDGAEAPRPARSRSRGRSAAKADVIAAPTADEQAIDTAAPADRDEVSEQVSSDRAPAERPVRQRAVASDPESERSSRSARSSRSERGPRSPRQERAPRAEQQPRSEQATPPEPSTRSEQPPRAERPSRAEQPPRQDRRDRPEPVRPDSLGGRNDRRGDNRRGEDRDDRPVVGLGDHVPAFLLRPTRMPRPTRGGDGPEEILGDEAVEDDVLADAS